MQAIVYCRLSKSSDNKSISLDSQEHAINKYLYLRGIKTFKILKSIGSAYNKPQTDICSVLSSCKNKELVVFSPNRLSRSLSNFENISYLCRKNKHRIHIVCDEEIYDMHYPREYQLLKEEIAKAAEESRRLGEQISRSYQYKKSRQAPWGFKCTNDEIVDDFKEQMTTKVIQLMNTKGTSIGKIEEFLKWLNPIKADTLEPFQIVEYDNKSEVIIKDKLPYSMSPKAICDTLRLYEIKYRTRYFTTKDVNKLIKDTESDTEKDTESDTEKNTDVMEVEEKLTKLSCKDTKWNCVFYDKNIGLPPGVKLPAGFTLPSENCMLYIPKVE